MSLTIADGPLANPRRGAGQTNYRIDGPAHALFCSPFPRRVRALSAGCTVLDSERGTLVHETGLLPQLYVPEADVAMDKLQASEHASHCPFKGDAAYWHLRSGERRAENAAWAYPRPRESAAWLRGLIAFYWQSLDQWFDENEEVFGHLRDPFHRVDARAASHRVKVTAGGETVAESGAAMLVSETGLPNRYYIPHADVRSGVLAASATRTVCPYKGEASYRNLRIGDNTIEDAAWVYLDPLPDAAKIAGLLCFHADGITVEAGGRAVG